MACPGSDPSNIYRAEDIQVLSGLEPIRRRPAMYIGSTDARGLSHLLFELVTNSLAEAVAGHGRSVRVTLRADGSAEVADDGRILPSSDSVEDVFTSYGTGYRGYCPYPGGREYAGYLFANALSERLRVVVRSDSSRYQHIFQRAVTHAVLQSGGPPDDRGLTIAFRPDPEIFGGVQFDRDAIRNRLQQLAFLHSRVRITFSDETTGTHEEFEYADGIAAYVRWLNTERKPLHEDVLLIHGEEQGVRYEIGLQWCEGDEEMRTSFANHYRTQNGGTHDNGVRLGVAAALRDFIREHTPQTIEFQAEDLRSGLTAVVSVWLVEPRFEYATRSRLGNSEVESIVRAAVRRGVREYLEANRDAANGIVNEVVLAQKLRVAAADARRQLRRKDE